VSPAELARRLEVDPFVPDSSSVAAELIEGL
jgi:hypothetical protein